MGERVQLGHLIYTVFETQWLTHLGEGPNTRCRRTAISWCASASPTAGPANVIVPGMSLVDDSGETHTEVSNGERRAAVDRTLRQVKPAESAQGNMLFDVPPKHYKLQVATKTEQRTALVDIPLTFGAETPELATPSASPAPEFPSPSGRK